jgi:type II secretory pathway pseudopilin PulG
MKTVESRVPFGTRQFHSNRQSGFAMVEAVIGAGLVALVIACLFATNAHLLGLLRQGKQSTFATQLIAERIEQFRTSAWQSLNNQTALKALVDNGGNPATSSTLSGVTETFTIQPYPNPTNIQIQCVKAPDGTSTASGTDFNSDTVTVLVDIQWQTGRRQRERQFATVMHYAGI